MIYLVSDVFIQSFTQSLKRRMSLKNTLYSCGVTYEIVSNVPKVRLFASVSGKILSCLTLSIHYNQFGWRYVLSSPLCLCLPTLAGLGGARREGNVGPYGCTRGQWGDTGWRNLHRKIHTGCSGGGEHPQFGEATTGAALSNMFTRWNTFWMRCPLFKCCNCQIKFSLTIIPISDHRRTCKCPSDCLCFIPAAGCDSEGGVVN